MAQLGLFYNTINLEGPELERAKRECNAQDLEVYKFFLANKGSRFTPLECWDSVGGLFTSVRRSINTLTNKGYLIKLGDTKPERYGKPNFCWTLKMKK